MPKLGMEPLRRRQIIDAVMDCIHTDGIEKASLKAIARHADVAPSLILHYFGGKDAVISSVYRDLYIRLGAATRVRLQGAHTPLERLIAILDAQVSAEMITPRVVSTWYAIGAQAMASPELARLERVNTRRMSSNIVHELRALGVDRGEARAIAAECLALVYGLWNLLAHGAVTDPAEAQAILMRSVQNRLDGLVEGDVHTERA